MVCEVACFTPTQLDDKEYDPTPKLAIYFNEKGVQDNFQLDQSMRFGLVLINAKSVCILARFLLEK